MLATWCSCIDLIVLHVLTSFLSIGYSNSINPHCVRILVSLCKCHVLFFAMPKIIIQQYTFGIATHTEWPKKSKPSRFVITADGVKGFKPSH